MAVRDLTLTPRIEDVRNKQLVASVIEFDLFQIKERFDNNLASIRKQFDIAEALKAEGNVEECGDHLEITGCIFGKCIGFLHSRS